MVSSCFHEVDEDDAERIWYASMKEERERCARGSEQCLIDRSRSIDACYTLEEELLYSLEDAFRMMQGKNIEDYSYGSMREIERVIANANKHLYPSPEEERCK